MKDYFYFIRTAKANNTNYNVRLDFNKITLSPLAKMQYTLEERDEIMQLLTDAGLVVEPIGKKSIHITDPNPSSDEYYDLKHIVEKIVPKSLTKADIKLIEDADDRRLKEHQKKCFYKETLEKHSDIAEWICDVLGKNVCNQHNLVYLTLFIAGEKETFEGLANWKWEKGLTKIGATEQNENGFVILFDKIKKAYQDSRK